MRRKIAEYIRDKPREVAHAAYEEFLIEKTESQKITPFRTGKLRDSHLVHEPEFDRGVIRVAITVGNDEVDYAAIVHENLDAIHPHGEAKFLEKTLRASASYMAARIARRTGLMVRK